MRQMNHSSENNNNPIWSNFTFKKPKNQDNTVKTSIFYINDVIICNRNYSSYAFGRITV